MKTLFDIAAAEILGRGVLPQQTARDQGGEAVAPTGRSRFVGNFVEPA
jgi:hypothetical protein